MAAQRDDDLGQQPAIDGGVTSASSVEARDSAGYAVRPTASHNGPPSLADNPVGANGAPDDNERMTNTELVDLLESLGFEVTVDEHVDGDLITAEKWQPTDCRCTSGVTEGPWCHDCRHTAHDGTCAASPDAERSPI